MLALGFVRGEQNMTVLEDVRDLVEGMRPHAVCDDCIKDRLGLSVRQHANHKTRELADTPEFVRCQSNCAVCRSVKLVIRRI